VSRHAEMAFEGQNVITTTHNAGPGRDLCMHVFAPIGADEILVATIPGLLFADFTSSFRLGDTGGLSILDDQGTFIGGFREDLVKERRNFVIEAKTNPAFLDIGEFFSEMISNEAGMGFYRVDGEESICEYKRLEDSPEGWYIAATHRVKEGPESYLWHGLLASALIFLGAGSVLAVLLSGVVARPFNTIEKQNRTLADLNETVRAQADRIQEESTRATLLLDSMPYTCHLWDKDIKLFACNEENVRLFNAENKQDFIENFHKFSPEVQPDGIRSSERAKVEIQRAFEYGKNTFEWMHNTADGTPIPCEVMLVRVPYEGDYVVAGYMRDLRAHKEMMRNIEHRDHLLDVLNNAANTLLQSGFDEFEAVLYRCMGMISEAVGVDRMYIWKNRSIEGRLHCTQIHEWIGRAVAQQGKKITIDVPYDESIPGWEETLSRGDCVHGIVRDMSAPEQAQLSPQGILSIFVVPVFLQDQFWGFVGYADCHNERFFSEGDLSIMRSGGIAIANAMLKNEMTMSLQNSAKQLESALEKARSASEAKTTFLARMSHEMRTPLNAVIGLSELTLDAGDLDEEKTANLEKIYSAGTTLLVTVNDILDISKIEAGKFELMPIEYDVPSLLNDTITQSSLHIGEKPIHFITDIGEELPAQLFGDELRIKQILNNLLSNAFKYTNEGTVEFSVRHMRDGDAVWLTAKVRDSGIGIRSEDMDALFKDYARLDGDATRKIVGTGLGLPIVKKLTEMMGGSITAESEYGKGSVFTLKIRQGFVSDTSIGRETAQNLKNARFSESKRGRHTRMIRIHLPYAHVLVVDDNATNLDVAKGIMRPYGMKIDCAMSGQEAVDAIREGKVEYNAIFMDHMMPGMDGIEATRIIREEIGTEYAKNIPIIALTANAIVGNEAMFLSKGFQAFLTKPIDLPRLDAVIREWVRDREKEKELGIANRNTCRIEKDGRAATDHRELGMKIDGLEQAKGLERFGDKESYFQVLRSFVENTRPLLESMKNPTPDALPAYTVTVHGIKGAAKGICANAVGNQAEALEHAAREGDFAFVEANNQAFFETAFKLVADIDGLLRAAAANTSKPSKEAPDADVLSRLLAACDAYDMDGVDAVMKEMDAYEYRADGGLAAWLRENVERMNFVEIKERLSSPATPAHQRTSNRP